MKILITFLAKSLTRWLLLCVFGPQQAQDHICHASLLSKFLFHDPGGMDIGIWENFTIQYPTSGQGRIL